MIRKSDVVAKAFKDLIEQFSEILCATNITKVILSVTNILHSKILMITV